MRTLGALAIAALAVGCGVTGPSETKRPGHFVGSWQGVIGGHDASGRVKFDDLPTEGFENRFGFVLNGALPMRADVWTWVMVRAERGGMRIVAEGIFDVWMISDQPDPTQEEGAFEDLWQRVKIMPSGFGLVVLIEEPKGDHRSR